MGDGEDAVPSFDGEDNEPSTKSFNDEYGNVKPPPTDSKNLRLHEKGSSTVDVDDLRREVGKQDGIVAVVHNRIMASVGGCIDY